MSLPRLITTEDDVRRLVEKVYQSGKAYTYDFETLGYRVKRLRPAGLGLAWGPGPDDGGYIVSLHEEHPYVPWDKVLEIVKPLFEDDSMTAVAHNQLFDSSILLREGVRLHTNTYDTMILAWLLNTESRHGLKALVKRRYDYQMTELKDICKEEVVAWHPGKVLRVDKAPIDQLQEYAIDDVRWTYRLWCDAREAVEADETLVRIYHDLYRELLIVLAELQVDGVMLDLPLIREREAQTQAEIDQLVYDLMSLRPGEDFPGELCAHWTAGDIDIERKRIPALQEKWKDRKTLRPLLYQYPTLAHKLFNLDSNPQKNKVVFQELGVKPIGEKGANGNYSLDAEVVSQLRFDDPTGFLERYQRYATLNKIQGTYHVGLQEQVDDDGRVRTSFNPALKTGRLSSSEPNLQNIPARTEDGKLVRKAFVAKPGCKLIVVDYSQAELRILAHLANDEFMIEQFKRGADPHSITAVAAFELDCDVFEVPEKFPHMRSAGKTINFGIVYGLGDEGIARNILKATKGELRLSRQDAKHLKGRVLANMPGVGNYIRYQESFAQRYGYVETVIGRPRHLPGALQREDKALFYGSLRMAVNAPIQGSAADIIHIAMRNIRRHFLETGQWRKDVTMLLQVHDELLFEARDDIAEETAAVIKEKMENALVLKVPMVAEPAVGSDWYSCK